LYRGLAYQWHGGGPEGHAGRDGVVNLARAAPGLLLVCLPGPVLAGDIPGFAFHMIAGDSALPL